MDNSLYNKLLCGGGYSLPYLIRLSNDERELFFINDARNATYGGKTYLASSFNFTPSDDGDSTLEISVSDNEIITLIDEEDYFSAEFVGILLEDGFVRELRSWKKRYGRAKWNGKRAVITFTSDERLSMTFPALIFKGDNNRGNS